MLIKSIFSGFGGQGVLMIGYVMAVSAMRDGLNVTYLPAYGAEVRGGTANCTVSISDEEIASPVASSPDYVVAFNRPSLVKYEGQIKTGGTLILNSDLIDMESGRDDIGIFKIPAITMAKELGNERSMNMIMLGAYIAKIKIISIDSLMNGLVEVLKAKNASRMDINRKGLEMGEQYVLKGA
ncbi:MAG: 2-oxoacid:acceptor oxidoreductase family protein [Thermodesulfobacteriota bacterium]|nr:2-oxoacid:acceptor oxidoreductase family protein [Thermodesulfobacteriota bacterium]